MNKDQARTKGKKLCGDYRRGRSITPNYGSTREGKALLKEIRNLVIKYDLKEVKK